LSFANATVTAKKLKRDASRFEHVLPRYVDWMIVSTLCV